MKIGQEKTPVFDAVKKYYYDRIIPFHVPGHKGGNGLPEFKAFVGDNLLGIDLTCMPDLDNICNPQGVIAEAEKLAAELYGANHAFFLVNGTTSGIQAMIMAVCKPGDKIIIPRNAHKSALAGLIISGAVPVYLEPEINREFGITMGITPEKVSAALNQHPDARALFIINPNYYGSASNLAEIVKIAHSLAIPVLVDEAHGAHFPFHPDLPLSAMEAGADLAASSTHKLVGSLTQSSMLLLKTGLVSPQKVKSVLNLTQTTSPSYILLSSLDVARKQMALEGEKLIGKTLELARWIRLALENIPGLKILGEEIVGKPGSYSFDPTKITVNVQGLGISGYEMENILRSQFKIQVELSDLYNALFLISIGDTLETAAYLVECIKKVAVQSPLRKVIKLCPPLPKTPRMLTTPREAFYSSTMLIPLEEAANEISAEAIMAYPPGIPLICPGEIITQDVIDYINILKRENASLQGSDDPVIKQIKVLKNFITKRIYEHNVSYLK